jgi:hypothetical protein
MSVLHGFFIGLSLLFGSLYVSTLSLLHITAGLGQTSIPPQALWVPLPVGGQWPYKIENRQVFLTIGDRFASPPTNRTLLSDADPNNFLVSTFWSSSFGKDKNHVYFYGQEIAGADPITFGPVFDSIGSTTDYFKDRKQVYYNYADGMDPIATADSITFQLVSDQSTYDAQDKNHKYLQGQIVQSGSQAPVVASEAQAIDLVKAVPEVRDWLLNFCSPLGLNKGTACGSTDSNQSPKTGAYAHIAIDDADQDSYQVYVYEEMPDHFNTFNYYKVNKETGQVSLAFPHP